LVVACMGEGVSTPWGYGKLDELYQNFTQEKAPDERAERLISAIKKGDVLENTDCFYNIFEQVVPPVRPNVTALKELMKSAGATVAMMSGSGPSVFGLFETQEAACKAVEALQTMGADAFVCHPTAAYGV